MSKFFYMLLFIVLEKDCAIIWIKRGKDGIMSEKMKIEIVKDGPYSVSGNIPLYEKKIIEEDGLMVMKTIKKIPTDGDYMLCRCGKSKDMPFCDGLHVEAHFDGTEVAENNKYMDRAEVCVGPEIDLYDDGRCAYARFCHQKHGDVWTLTLESNDPVKKKEVIAGSNQCPSGRLVVKDKDGKIIEPKLEPCISIVQDIPERCSSGIFVTGNIPLYSANKKQYEIQNRMMLCRCGASSNKPFCDATHDPIHFDDTLIELE